MWLAADTTTGVRTRGAGVGRAPLLLQVGGLCPPTLLCHGCCTMKSLFLVILPCFNIVSFTNIQLHINMPQNAPKMIYRDVKFQNFPGGAHPQDPPRSGWLGQPCYQPPCYKSSSYTTDNTQLATSMSKHSRVHATGNEHTVTRDLTLRLSSLPTRISYE